MDLFEEPAWPDGEPAQAAAEVSATARPSFPEDLALACSGKPVAEARAYRAVPSLMHWPSSMAAGSCTPRGSNGLVRNVHVLEVRVFEARERQASFRSPLSVPRRRKKWCGYELHNRILGPMQAFLCAHPASAANTG